MNVIRILALTLLLSACATVKTDPLPAGTGVEIPVDSVKIEDPEGVSREAEGGKAQEEKTELLLTVPPSSTPTHIKIAKRDLSPLKRTMTNEPEHKVTSDNPNVTAEQPKKPGLWKRWGLALIGGFLLLVFIGGSIWHWLKNISPAGLVTGCVKRLCWWKK